MHQPFGSSACSVVSAVYNSVREGRPCIRSDRDVAEKEEKPLTDVTVTGSRPLIGILEPPVATSNDFDCKGLGKQESNLAFLQQPTGKAVLKTNTVTGARDTVTGATSDILGWEAGAVQGGVGVTKSLVSTVMATQVGLLITSSLNTVFGKSEEWVNGYPPEDR
ncbi:hypothetical protein GDO81_001968 [Engystomops pustulosus]|uniref:Uncharacterized protein n=1 Tax=Engystomops pustulosus TaxID=76066 RepID=A0AAV7DGE7_ENGPU|nr:hypothetical protein GDO81_001968 [Engystomops pustulosus]